MYKSRWDLCLTLIWTWHSKYEHNLIVPQLLNGYYLYKNAQVSKLVILPVSTLLKEVTITAQAIWIERLTNVTPRERAQKKLDVSRNSWDAKGWSKCSPNCKGLQVELFRQHIFPNFDSQICKTTAEIVILHPGSGPGIASMIISFIPATD